MYVGVIRGDMPGPIFISDVEQVSQVNFPIEPSGQATYVARPSVTQLTNYLGGLDSNYDNTPFQGSGGVPAGVESSSAITFPVTLTGSNNVLSVKNISTASFTNVTIATGTYVNMAALVAAVNLALAPTGLATAAISSTGTLLIIQSTVVGVGSYIAINTTVGGSTFNTPANFASGGVNFTMPTAAAIIAGLLPVGGPLNVSSANVLTYLGAAPAATGAVSLIAPHFTETTPVIQSFQIGVMSKFLEASYNPDPTLLPALANGAAITCVMDDGMTAYTAPLPIISSAAHSVPNPGDITITGSDLGNSEFFGATTVRVTGVSPAPGVPLPFVKLGQKLITNTLSGGTQGSVSPTSIVIPASLLTTTTGVVLGVAGSTVEVQFTTLKNGNYGSVANIASAAVGAPFINGTNTIQNNLVVTLTGLANMTSSAVGQPITISGAASAGNNGTFIITAVLSSSSVTINNSSAVAPDANNSHILWSQGGPVQFPVS